MRRALVALVALVGASTTAIAAADPAPPSQWPQGVAIGSAPNAIRFGGVDRYATSLAVTLALRGEGGYPFESPDRTSGGSDSLAGASGWFGAATCPRSVLIVAGDTPADALTAASLSDPTDRSNEPRLPRVAAADPLFDPIGGTDRVDTGAAPIVVTASTRAGARGLSPSAALALDDLASGGCTAAREAVIVGGRSAVPLEVEGQLVAMGYEEVFRVAGEDRYETAAKIAAALGTEPIAEGTPCLDPSAADGSRMGFYGNAAIEFRSTAEQCEVLDEVVVLADGETGADALAAGWWTSYWQVPVLLTAGDGTLPPPTRLALQTIDVETIVVLGGTARIPEETVDEAKALAGAVAGRFAGRDRYETSVRMAQVFGGWHATKDSDDAAGSRLCLAASDGGAAGAGWPDALAAGPFCGRLAATGRPSPQRALEPIASAVGTTGGTAPARDAVPILLVPPRSRPTDAVAELLSATFFPGGRWCAAAVTTSCRAPGFAIAFGGRAVVPDVALATVSALLSGGDEAQRGSVPSLEGAFRTGLDLAPLYENVSVEGEELLCLERGSMSSVRWLAAYGDQAQHELLQTADLLGTGAYATTDRNEPLCVGTPHLDLDLWLTGVAVDGDHVVVELPAAPARTDMSGSVVTAAVEVSGEDGAAITPGASTSWRFATADAGVDATVGTETWAVDAASLEITVLRDASGVAGTFVGTALLEGAERLVVEVRGEAVFVGSRWEIAGIAVTDRGRGGFRGAITPRAGSSDGDSAFWRLDLHGR